MLSPGADQELLSPGGLHACTSGLQTFLGAPGDQKIHYFDQSIFYCNNNFKNWTFIGAVFYVLKDIYFSIRRAPRRRTERGREGKEEESYCLLNVSDFPHVSHGIFTTILEGRYL